MTGEKKFDSAAAILGQGWQRHDAKFGFEPHATFGAIYLAGSKFNLLT